MQPHEVQREGFRWLPTIIIFAVVATVGFFTWAYFAQALMFKLDTSNVRHQLQVGVIQASGNYQITQNSKAYQDALIGQMDQHLTNIEGAGGLAVTRASLPASSGEQASLRASELSEVREFCSEAQNVVPGNPALGGTNIPGVPTLRQIIAANCIAGAPRENPPLAMNPVPDGGA